MGSASTRDQFMSHLRRILDSGGRVTLVLLDPSSPQIVRLQRATSVDYTGRIHASLNVLGELRAELQPAPRDRLRVTALTDHLMLPYMVVGNEHRLVTASYLGTTDTDNSQVGCSGVTGAARRRCRSLLRRR
jgi:hypothetical protein